MAAIVFETFNSKKSPCLQFSNCEQGDFSIQERIWFVPSARPPITPVLLFVPRYFSFSVTSKETEAVANDLDRLSASLRQAVSKFKV